MTDYYCENCEFFEDKSTDKLIDGYCKKYNQSLNFYDWWEKCDNCVIETLKAENTALRERLDKTEKEIDEYKRKIKYGKLVEPVWFISFLNGLPCYGRVIGYQEDSGFVMQCSDCMISAKKIYLSEEEAEKERKKESKD